ncbi:tRNA (carboxymethyluridine(34)-5-O)-methyltransferase [Salvia miltiorrhiza]|uniref:tRNA (carboxymethyluridine(34)-5-O)-methyltransferase n=1 Tax=Salvia miltiorrhiza TaxID=226208 RepID=UPI0025ACFC8A|nr:tRNA (carboxymethyluridine(34)-5-O)-methyltransferase [Salvia miltiorrhiza]XP_057766088.1 tRNA (carboxymethyluridine(34)-5-O)-methyltransferase [Salvia miltiorrhiza]XP_057766089.1 tRNA (carboxymethyluridine(34)-5-O)-methyltransferase [Salvia miltiorrhiza]XP_057766090.1 tRNA (carboxymethyluridine(34)-5-O)-methyltransferase [Salvia miltiorrhiza]
MIFSVRRGFSIGKAQASSATCHLKSLCTMKEEKRDDFLGSSAASREEFPVLRPIIAGNNKKSSSSKVQVTPEIEKTYVHRVYDAIAPHFSSTRFSKWPKVEAFLNSLPSGSLILDAGCGNGKYLGLNPNCYFVGCDISAPLINICSDRGHEVLVADALNLPFRTGYGDAAISIAVLHHLSSESRRKKAVEELIRIVKKGGLILITVWAREQEDNSLVKKWTPLSQKYVEEWIGPGSPRTWSPSSSISLESISETEESVSGEQLRYLPKESENERLNDIKHPSSIDRTRSPSSSILLESISETEESASGEQSIYLPRESEDERSNKIKCPSSSDEPFSLDSTIKRSSLHQQDYFVPWHLPYHRAEVSGASWNAVSNGFARRDDKKGAVVYDRYYHVFSEGELERLVSNVDGAVIVDRFYDKSNWCIILEKTSS